jgi:hypothetical protein
MRVPVEEVIDVVDEEEEAQFVVTLAWSIGRHEHGIRWVNPARQ